MSQPNPYQTPDANQSGEGPQECSRVAPTDGGARLVRGLEYAVALLIVLALVWVVNAFVISGMGG